MALVLVDSPPPPTRDTAKRGLWAHVVNVVTAAAGAASARTAGAEAPAVGAPAAEGAPAKEGCGVCAKEKARIAAAAAAAPPPPPTHGGAA